MAKVTPKLNKDFDPLEAVEDIIRKGFDPAIFDLVDDSDFRPAANVYEFITSKKFLNIRPFPRQIQLGLQLFSDYCPGKTCTDPKIIDNLFDQEIDEILDRVSILEHGICPKCGKSRGKRLVQHMTHIVDEMAACCGQRSGKSTTVAMLANYQLHRFLCLPNPSTYFGLLPNTVLHMNFIALTYGQADDTLFVPFQAFYDNCEWFKEYNEMLDYYQNKHSLHLYDNKKTFLLYNHKRLLCNPMGPDKRKLRGLTRFFSAIDELGWFFGDGIKYDADEVYVALENSLLTVRSAARSLHDKGFYNAPIAISTNISSPSTANDKIMRLVREGESNPYKVSAHYATWEFNPTITRRSLNKVFITKPKDSARDFGADPPLSDTPFFQNKKAIADSVSDVKQSKFLNITEKINTDKFGDKTKYLKVNLKMVDKKVKRIMAVDTGHKNNAFAVGIMHLDDIEDTAIVDFIIEARPTGEIPVNLSRMYRSVIEKIADYLNIVMCIFDRWNSITMRETLLDRGVGSEQYTLKWDDFIAMRNLIDDKRIILPQLEVPFSRVERMREDYETLIRNKPAAHLALQLLTVREVGKKVEKGDGFDDDIFRTIALGQKFLFDPDYKHLFQGEGSGFSMVNRDVGKVYSRGGLNVGDTKGKQAVTSPYMSIRTKRSYNTGERAAQSNIGVLGGGSGSR